MRYERQRIMEKIGDDGQKKLMNSRIVVIGAGGLASPVLIYLACAGIGEITVVDYDVVSETNLNRQFLHKEKDVGKFKVVSAKEMMEELNSEIKINAIVEKLNKDNVEKMLYGADVVIDCVDNVETRITVNRACITLDIPLVEAGISGFYGFVLAVKKEYSCLECIGYENIKLHTPVPALGAVVGVIGALQAVECIKIILGLEGVLYGKMLNYDGLTATFETVDLHKNSMCKAHVEKSIEL